MYLWVIFFKTWMKTRHAIPPSQTDEPAKCHICPQLPLMLRHKRDIELPRRSPAMFVEYQLGFGPAWALFQELEWEGEEFGCVKNMRQGSDLKQNGFSANHNCKKETSQRLSLASCCACWCAVPEVPYNRITIHSQLSIKCAMLFSLSILTYHSL